MTIKIGDILNRAGSTPLLDASTLFGQQWINGSSADGKIKPTSGWQLGYESGWSVNEDGTGQVNVAAINEGSELGVYLMSAGVTNLGIQPPVVVDDPVKGPLRITPRLMTAAERAKIDTRAYLATYTWLSAAMVTRDALAPPAYFEITAQLPKGPGCWPAWWFLRPGQWPPEIDCFEIFNAQMTTAIHSTAGEWISKLAAGTTFVRNSGPDFSALQNLLPGFDPSTAPHRYGTLVYPDQICTFIDGVCMQAWPTPADLAASPLYALIDFAVGAPGSGAGTPPAGATSIGSYVISAIDIRAMPAVYGAGTVPAPIPTPVPVPIPVPAPASIGVIATPGKGILTVGGNTFTIDAAGNALANGTPVVNGDGTAALVLFNGTIYGQDATAPANWYPLVNGVWGVQITAPLPWGSTTPAPLAPAPVPAPIPVPVPSPVVGLSAAQKTAVLALGTDLTKLQADYAAVLKALGM